MCTRARRALSETAPLSSRPLRSAGVCARLLKSCRFWDVLVWHLHTYVASGYAWHAVIVCHVVQGHALMPHGCCAPAVK